MTAYEYRVIVKTTDERPEAAERIEREVRRLTDLSFGPEAAYVELVLPVPLFSRPFVA